MCSDERFESANLSCIGSLPAELIALPPPPKAVVYCEENFSPGRVEERVDLAPYAFDLPAQEFDFHPLIVYFALLVGNY